MNGSSTVDPPTRPFRKPRVSRARLDDEDADAVTVTTAVGSSRTSRTSQPIPIVVTPARPVLPARRLPPPSQTGRFPSPRPRDGADPDTVTVAATGGTGAVATPRSTPVPDAASTPRPSSGAVAAPAASTPVRRTPAPAPATPAQTGSAAALERAGLVGLHPLTREQPVKRGMRRLVAQVPAPYSVVGDGEDVPALLTRMYAMVVRDHWGGGDGDTTHVVQLTPWYACDLGFELVGAGRILGHAPVHGDVTPELPVDPPEPDDPASAPLGAPTPTLLSLRHPGVDDVVRAALGDAERVIVVADTARSDRRAVQQTVADLRELDVVVAGLVIYRGRIPRDPAYGR